MLTEIVNGKFTTMIHGERDSLKTTLGALAVGFYGNFEDKAGLLNFNDTAANLQYLTFILKDVCALVDDYHPVSGRVEAEKAATIIQGLIRNAGNRTSRGRMGPDMSARPRYYPRGVLLLTAEKLPGIQSTRTRTW